MKLEDLQSYIDCLNPSEVSELGRIASWNALYVPDDMDGFTVSELEDGYWVLQREGDYHQDFEDVEVPMRSRSKQVIEAFRYLLEHDLGEYYNKDKSPDVIEEWRRKFHAIDFNEDERKELRSIEDALTNEIITSISISDPFQVHTNKDGTYSIRIFSVPLEGLEIIRHKKIADLLLLSLYLHQLPAQY